jgi:hypothetical protein
MKKQYLQNQREALSKVTVVVPPYVELSKKRKLKFRRCRIAL